MTNFMPDWLRKQPDILKGRSNPSNRLQRFVAHVYHYMYTYMSDASPSERDRVIWHINESGMDLTKEAQGPPSYWAGLPLCIIDGVFSIGVRYYPGLEKVVIRWCETQEPKWEQTVPFRPTRDIGPTMRDFIGIIRRRLESGSSYENLFSNRWRTLSRNGILK